MLHLKTKLILSQLRVFDTDSETCAYSLSVWVFDAKVSLVSTGDGEMKLSCYVLLLSSLSQDIVNPSWWKL